MFIDEVGLIGCHCIVVGFLSWVMRLTTQDGSVFGAYFGVKLFVRNKCLTAYLYVLRLGLWYTDLFSCHVCDRHSTCKQIDSVLLTIK